MEPIYKMEWRPIKHTQNPQLRTTMQEEYNKEMAKIENMRQRKQELENYKRTMHFGPRKDKQELWDKMNQELKDQREVSPQIFFNTSLDN